RRRHTRFSRDWSSDVCSSDLLAHTKYLTSFGIEISHYITHIGFWCNYLHFHNRLQQNRACLLESIFKSYTTRNFESHFRAINIRSEERRVGKDAQFRHPTKS